MNHSQKRNLYNRAYRMWKKMIKTSNHTMGSKIDPEWLEFPKFYEWYVDNHYDALDGRLTLNYNIIDKQNKYFSPDKCILLPTKIHNLFKYRDVKNRELPHGVSKMGQRYSVTIRNPLTNKVVYCGSADTPEEAFEIFRINKSKFIWQYVKQNGDDLPNRIYNLLMSYQVELDD